MRDTRRAARRFLEAVEFDDLGALELLGGLGHADFGAQLAQRVADGDEIARAVGLDPLDVRKRNLYMRDAAYIIAVDRVARACREEDALLVFDSLEAAQAWADADPYVAAGVYAAVTVKPFKQVFPK